VQDSRHHDDVTPIQAQVLTGTYAEAVCQLW
jgi:hypothetical protein